MNASLLLGLFFFTAPHDSQASRQTPFVLDHNNTVLTDFKNLWLHNQTPPESLINIILHTPRQEHGPLIISAPQNDTLYLTGDNPEKQITIRACNPFSSVTRFDTAPPKGDMRLYLETREPLPAAANGWKLSGSLNLTVADQIIPITIILPDKEGESVPLPLDSVIPDLLPKGASASLVAQKLALYPSGYYSDMTLHINSNLPEAWFGPSFIIDGNNKGVSAEEPDTDEAKPEGTACIYKHNPMAKKQQFTFTFFLYVNKRTISVPVNLHFGMGGVIVPQSPSPQPLRRGENK